jgi:hypothetical protein
VYASHLLCETRSTFGRQRIKLCPIQGSTFSHPNWPAGEVKHPHNFLLFIELRSSIIQKAHRLLNGAVLDPTDPITVAMIRIRLSEFPQNDPNLIKTPSMIHDPSDPIMIAGCLARHLSISIREARFLISHTLH